MISNCENASNLMFLVQNQPQGVQTSMSSANNNVTSESTATANAENATNLMFKLYERNDNRQTIETNNFSQSGILKNNDVHLHNNRC